MSLFTSPYMKKKTIKNPQNISQRVLLNKIFLKAHNISAAVVLSD